MDKNTLHIDEKILWRYKSGYENNEGGIIYPCLGESTVSLYYLDILVTKY